MAYDLFIAYDLNTPGQNYDLVRDRIKSLGQWYQFQFSLFYVSSEHSPDQVFSHVNEVMDTNDRLARLDGDLIHKCVEL